MIYIPFALSQILPTFWPWAIKFDSSCLGLRILKFSNTWYKHDLVFNYMGPKHLKQKLNNAFHGLLEFGLAGACCACSRCGTGGLFFIFFISSILSSFSNASSVGRRLDVLKYCGLGRYNSTVVVSYYWRRARLVLVNRLVGLRLPRNSVNG